MTTMDEIWMLVPSETPRSQESPPPLSITARGIPGPNPWYPGQGDHPGHHVRCTPFGSPSPWDVQGTKGTIRFHVPVAYWFYWLGDSVPVSLCR